MLSSMIKKGKDVRQCLFRCSQLNLPLPMIKYLTIYAFHLDIQEILIRLV